MTARYIALAKPPRAWVSSTHTPEMLPTTTVYVPDETPRDTGLVTAEGVPLYRLPTREPIGFKR